MPKTGPGKDIAGKIIDFLRQNDGKAVISQTRDTTKFGCTHTALQYSLHRLMEAGIITTLGRLKRGARKPIEFILSDEFKEGNDWREALKRKSSGGKAEAGPSIPAEACHSEECLRARKVLLEELVETFEKLKVSQEENQSLSLAVEKLQKEIGDLRSEAEKKGNVCHQLRSDVGQLESRLLALRAKTSQSPAIGRKLKFDDSGIVILPGEERPDRS